MSAYGGLGDEIILTVEMSRFFPYLNANTLTSYLKLGKKYDMPFLYQEALFCMRSEFPSDLESFAHTVRGASVRNIPRHQFMYYNNSDLIPLANIVFDIGALDAFLAVVIRLSCVHDYAAIVTESQTPLAPELESLVIKCQGDAEKMIQDAMSYPTPSCKSSGCKTDEEDWWTKKKWSLFRPHIFHPVTPGEYFRGQICPVCITAAKKSWKDVRYKWWMSLPSTLGFDIPKWGKKRTVLELQGELGCFFCEMRCQV